MHRAPKTSTRFGKLALVIALMMVVGMMAAGPLAGADVDRQQVKTLELTATLFGSYEHRYIITTECGTTYGTGEWRADWAAPSGNYTTETLTNVVWNGDLVSFDAVYDGPHSPGYTYHFEGNLTTGFSTANDTFGAGSWTNSITDSDVTEYRNHGAFVKQSEDKKAAAQSCVGMPEVSG